MIQFVTPFPVAEFEGLERYLGELELPNTEIVAGVASIGEAAEYALTWEFGNVHQTKKGPKTVLGIGPDGSRVWLSIQAPFGYIRINENRYWEIIADEAEKVALSGTTPAEIRRELEDMARRVTERVADVIQDTVPVDTGALRASIQPVQPGDPLLSEVFRDEEETGLVERLDQLIF